MSSEDREQARHVNNCTVLFVVAIADDLGKILTRQHNMVSNHILSKGVVYTNFAF